MLGFDFNRNQKLAMLVLIGLCLVGLSYAHLAKTQGLSSRDLIFREAEGDAGRHSGESDPMPGERPSGEVVCHVVGCVDRPGVYTLKSGERVIDAINAAGGASASADVNALNLAQKIDDGSRIYVPSLAETSTPASGATPEYRGRSAASPRTAASGGQSSGQKLSVPGEGVVHINSAGVDELQRLPGVGPATAQKILDYRKSIGRFTRPEQIIDVNGIGPKKYERMRPFVAL